MSSESQKQVTIEGTHSWEGTGLHSGTTSRVTVHPADPGFGIKFIVDGSDAILPADIKYVSSTERSTNLSNGKIDITTVEHMLSAAYGAGITNMKIEVEGPEIPILDGSAQSFFEWLHDHRIEQEETNHKIWTPDRNIEFTDPESGSSYILMPSPHLELDVIMEYKDHDLGRQVTSFGANDDFSNFADARTFVLTSELESLCQKGLIKGGSLDNAVLISSGETGRQELEKAVDLLGKTNKEEILESFDRGHELKYKDELARHKLVDLIGDLSLLGVRINARIIAKKPGHTGNTAFMRHLKPLVQKALRQQGRPNYDPSAKAIYNTVEIQGFLPHRYPFLLVDKIIELSDTKVVGVKNVSFNEYMFQGHFPGNPVFPGVLQMEALAQTGGILALNTVDNPSDWDTYFLKMNNVKFKRKVVPGDTLILKMELLSPIRRGIVHMQGTAYVGDYVVSEGELTAQIVDRTTLK